MKGDLDEFVRIQFLGKLYGGVHPGAEDTPRSGKIHNQRAVVELRRPVDALEAPGLLDHHRSLTASGSACSKGCTACGGLRIVLDANGDGGIA